MAFTTISGILEFQVLSRPHRGHICPPIHPSLPGPLHHRPSHPVPLGRHRRPSRARRTTERRRPRRRSSCPDPELPLRRPSRAGRSSGCRFHHNPSQPGPPPGSGRRHAGAPALRESGLAIKGEGLWSEREAGGRMGGRRVAEEPGEQVGRQG